MKLINIYTTLFISLILLNFSCQKETLDNSEKNFSQQPSETLGSSATNSSLILNSSNLNNKIQSLSKLKADDPVSWLREYLNASGDPGAIVPTVCGPTQFNNVVNNYLGQFGPYEAAYYGTYAAINQIYTVYDQSKQYFGSNGGNTHLVVKHQRNLEKFWNMANLVTINGEHNSTLNDRDKIASVYILIGYPADVAYAQADFIISFNLSSPVFIETPLLSFDAFSTTGKLIVLGDGIIQALGETGIDNDVVIAGVLSHEWGHQVQFINSLNWYGFEFGTVPPTPEFTRLTELEADFFSSYYLTHKKGATYNWKRVEEFFTLFFNIGDCQFASASHHGTPDQRFAAARLGYNVAQDTFPKGKVLSPDELNATFMAFYNNILAGNIP